ncbi:hypothetical protein TPR58_19600 [Sphingomonas sp. HF-S3]|uniref:Uncharacterized protein n=1 Tax=Sphingomonas rustica TaxID=3103142 RepID=A0ABV0BCY8_9SPHN
MPLFIAALLLTATPIATEDWVVLDDENGSTISLDRASIQANGTERSFRIRLVSPEENGVIDAVADCTQGWIEPRHTELTKNGTTSSQDYEPGAERVAPTDPLAKKMLATACGK